MTYLRPAQLRPGDRVLVNDGWWEFSHVGAAHLVGPTDGPTYHEIRLRHGDDYLVVNRDGAAALVVDRPAPPNKENTQ